jgi:3-methyladenine DNA glycosylase AlkC
MTARLKDFFGERVVRAIAEDLTAAHRGFDQSGFVARSLDGLEKLELIARGGQIAEALHEYLPRPFSRAAKVILRSLSAGSRELGLGGGPLPASFRYLPHVLFVQRYGLADFESSMRVQYELTQRFTAESSIRPFLVRYPEQTLARLTIWASDPNVHVRRLVSEGTRPRLPWAPRLRAFQRDPRPVLELLELLKDDPERYVQRSVANNLNDIGKDHPETAVEVCRRWARGAPPERLWIVRHALRSLIKSGHRGALETLGVGRRPRVRIGRVELAPASVELEQELRFCFELSSLSSTPQPLMIDYAVHFVKANGSTSPKTFKLKRLTLEPSERVLLAGKVSFAKLTTRRHYPGLHRLELSINGVTEPLGEFEVRASRREMQRQSLRRRTDSTA